MSIDYHQLTTFRRALHAHPEVSGQEKETAATILAFLQSCKADRILSPVGGHGIVATWDSGVKGIETVFRAELDGLPIKEINDVEYASKISGVSHTCGHDGHSTILCGLAQHLSAHRPAKGKVHLLFQPAEENGEGAKAMLEDDTFSHINPDFVFALHNLPGYPLHHIIVKEGTFTAAVNSIIIHLHGKTSHAAEPENGINPALAVSEIIAESIAMANNVPEREDMRVVTPVYIELGEKAYGISAGRASVHLTVRCWNDENLRLLEEDIESLSGRIAKAHHLDVDFEYTQSFHANMNNTEAVDWVRKSAIASHYTLVERQYPFKWGEDFGLFTSRFTGCMFGIGSGEKTPALHNPDYDFPDEIIETGVRMFSGIIRELHSDS